MVNCNYEAHIFNKIDLLDVYSCLLTCPRWEDDTTGPHLLLSVRALAFVPSPDVLS